MNKVAFLQADDELSPASLYLMNADGWNQTKLTETGEFLFAGRPLAWSPDSARMAFGTIGGIYMIDISNGSISQLTNSENEGISPVWSSDGQKIAFTRIISEEEASIYVMNSDGSGQKQIATIKPSIVNTPLDWINSVSK